MFLGIMPIHLCCFQEHNYYFILICVTAYNQLTVTFFNIYLFRMKGMMFRFPKVALNMKMIKLESVRFIQRYTLMVRPIGLMVGKICLKITTMSCLSQGKKSTFLLSFIFNYMLSLSAYFL